MNETRHATEADRHPESCVFIDALSGTGYVPGMLIEDLLGVVGDAEALKRARALAGEADEYVRANPWQIVGAAAAIALLPAPSARSTRRA